MNQLTKHQEKQHPGFVPPVDGGARRRRQSTSMPPTATQTRNLCYPDEPVRGLLPTVLPPAAPAAGPPPLPDEMVARNAAAMLPWSMPPWSPFNFLQRMAAAAAVSGLPLCSPSTMSASAQRPADMKPFQLPPSTLSSSQSLELVPGELGPTSTPQKLAVAALGGRRDVLPGGLSSSPLSTTPTSDMDTRRSFFARLAAASAAAVNQQKNITRDDATSDTLVVARAPADNSDISRATCRTLMSPSSCLRSNFDGVSDHRRSQSVRDMSKCTNVSAYGGHTLDDDRPLDLTAKTSVTAVPMERPAEDYRPLERDAAGTNNYSQLSVRKTSRRKGVAHKLDTTCINQWPHTDVTNEPFNLIPLSTPSRSASEPQLVVCRQSSSPDASSSAPRGSSDDPQEATLNGATYTREQVDEESSTEKDHSRPSAGLHQQQSEVGDVSPGNGDEDDASVVDVIARQRLNVADGGLSSTPPSNECRHCGFVFKHPAMFDIHMGFHKFDDPWRCNRCGQRCTDCVDFNRHIATAPHLGQV